LAGEPGWVPPGVDVRRAITARVYDYWLGGSHNFLADQDVGRAIAAVQPTARAGARAGREFLRRAVQFLAASGVRQFLDIGSGIPTQGNVHEVAQQADPAARVAYVDIDPVAIAHSKAILAGNQNAAIIGADLRDPAKILVHDATRRLIDFTQPTGPGRRRPQAVRAGRANPAACSKTLSQPDQCARGSGPRPPSPPGPLSRLGPPWLSRAR
jgi:hypothetical protein